MEELQKNHRQERRDLQARITQKKKSATKKTRKGVNDECANLERELQERQTQELAVLSQDPADSSINLENDDVGDQNPATDEADDAKIAETNGESISGAMGGLTISNTAPANGNVKKPNRQKARLARRAAEQEAAAEEARKEAADLPDLREQERQRMREAYESKGLVEHEIRSDGHCLYAAIADQLDRLGVTLPASSASLGSSSAPSATHSGYKATRTVAAAYIRQHPDDFAPFIEQPLETYVQTIRETGEWGGHLEILALARAYHIDINVLQGDGRVESISGGQGTTVPTLWLAYYHHNYGLGEHYNSLRQRKS